MSIRVTAVDLESGDICEQVIQAGNFVIVTADPCYLSGEQHYANGTSVLTLKRRAAHLVGGVHLVRPSGSGDGDRDA